MVSQKPRQPCVCGGSKYDEARRTRLALEQVLGLIRRNVRDGGEDICAVSRGPLNAVSVVDAALAGLVVDVKVLQVVVEVDRARTEVPTKQGRVRREDGRDVNVSLAAAGKVEGGSGLAQASGRA